MYIPFLNRLFGNCLDQTANEDNRTELKPRTHQVEEPAQMKIDHTDSVRASYETEYKRQISDLVIKALEQAAGNEKSQFSAKATNNDFQVTVSVPKSFDFSKIDIEEFISFNAKLYAEARLKADQSQHPLAESTYNGVKFQLFLPDFVDNTKKSEDKKDSDKEEDIFKCEIEDLRDLPNLIPIETKV